jgi:Spy/CpxP family protein refolding chaperone
MKMFRTLLTTLALGLTTSAVLTAQDQAPTSPPAEGRRGKGGQRPEGGAPGRGQMMNPEARVAELDRRLSLTAAQKARLTEIFTQARTEMEGLRGGGGGGGNREKAQQMMQATRDQVAGVLTDEQKKKFEEGPQMGGGGRGKAKGEKGERPRGGPGGAGKRKKGDNA